MKNIIVAEHIKLKHSFGNKLPIISPIVTIFLVFALMGGIQNTFSAGAWNWWYVMLLPGFLAIFCYLVVKKDSKLKFHNIMAVCIPIEKSWLGKIIYCFLELILSNLLMFIGTSIVSIGFGSTIPVINCLAGAILLTITYLWEIPLYLYLSAKFNVFLCLFSSILLSIIGVVFLSDSKVWWLFPSAIPVRLMCSVLGLHPNGLPILTESDLLSSSVILPGVIISIFWFVILTYFLVSRFRKLEV